MTDTKHRPELLTAGRDDVWIRCPCGWKCGVYKTADRAYLAYDQHLVTPPSPRS